MKNKKSIVVILLIIIILICIGVIILSKIKMNKTDLDIDNNIMVSNEVINYANLTIGGSGIIKTYEEYLKITNNKNLNMISNGTAEDYDRSYFNPGRLSSDDFNENYYIYNFMINNCSYDYIGVQNIEYLYYENMAYLTMNVNLYKASYACARVSYDFSSENSVSYTLYLIPISKDKVKDNSITKVTFNFVDYDGTNNKIKEYDLYKYYSNSFDTDYKGLLSSKEELSNLISTYNFDINSNNDLDFDRYYYTYYIIDNSGCFVGYRKVKNIELTEWDSIKVDVYKDYLICPAVIDENPTFRYELLLVPINKKSINKDYDVEFNFVDYEEGIEKNEE